MNSLRRIQFVMIAAVVLSTGHHVPAADDRDLASLNAIVEEDTRLFPQLSAQGQLIQPSCPSMLAELLTFPPVPIDVRFPAGIEELWYEAAAHDETDLKLQAAEAIARAHEQGMPGLEGSVPLLLKLLDANDSDDLVRLAAARALIVLDARDAAPALQKHANDGFDFVRLIEPALAAWNETAMQDVWLKRLDEQDVPGGSLLLAIQASATMGLSDAAPALWKIASGPAGPPHLRIEAARALGRMDASDNVEHAQQLMSGPRTRPGFLAGLLAAQMLSQAGSDAAVALLSELAMDDEPATVAVALRRLLDLDPQLTKPVIERAIESPDAGVRLLAAESLLRLHTPDDIARLSDLLDDRHPRVRAGARRWLIEADDDEDLTSSVRESTMQMLNSDRPRGMAQAAVVMGTIDHKPAAGRLVELLNDEAGDVGIAVGWALRRLAVAETAEPVLKHLRLEVEDSLIERPKPSRGGPSLDWRWDMYEQHKHLIELLGILKHRPADDLLRQFIPFPSNPPLGHPFVWIHCTHRRELRSRAFWALGEINSEQPPEDLVGLMIGRLQDDSEVSHVAAMAALSLGSMRTEDAKAALRGFYQPGRRYSEEDPPASILGLACRAALEKITNESLPPLPVDAYTIYRTGWFLEPLDVEASAPTTDSELLVPGF